MSIRSTTNSDYMTGPAPAVAFSVTCWSRVDAVPGAGTFDAIWSVDDNNVNFISPYYNNSNLQHGFAHGIGDPVLVTGVSANTWYFTASLVNPGSPGVCFVGVNGGALTKVTDGVANTGTIPDTTISIMEDRSLGDSLLGDGADYRIYDRLLSEQEIRATYLSRTPISMAKLRAWLPLLEKSAPERPRAGFSTIYTHHGTLGWSALQPPRIRRRSALFG